MDYLNKTVMKSLEILIHFKSHPEISLKQLVQLTNLPKSTLHRIVLTLENQGFLTRVGTDTPRFQLGLALLELGQLVASNLEIRKIALPFMHSLRDQVNEAVNLIIRDGNEAVYVEKVDTSHPVRVYTQVGRRAPLYAGVCPRTLLSFLPDTEINTYLSNTPLVKIGAGTIINKDEILNEIEKSRLLGYTVSYGELETESAAVGVPIRDYTGNVIAGISIAGPIHRFTEKEVVEEIANKAKFSASQISAQMGYQ